LVELLPEAQKALAAAVTDAQMAFRGSVEGVKRLINDLYTGRDPVSGGLPTGGIPWGTTITDPTSTQKWVYPQVGANLAQARTQQLVTELVPAVPAFHVEALTAEATHLVEEQAVVMPWLAKSSGLRRAMRKTAMNGLLGSHFGVKVCINPSELIENRIRFEAIPSSHCGYEPQHRRFYWHQYATQYSDLKHKPKVNKSNPEPKPWDIVQVTEVYHRGFAYTGKKCPMSVFVSLGEAEVAERIYVANSPTQRQQALGDYVTTVELPTCPLYIDQFLDPAPGEDISPPEVASWIPVLRSIHADLRQLEGEVGKINDVVFLEKGAFDDTDIAAMRDNPSGTTLYVEVRADNAMGEYTGVSHKGRPMERNSAINEILASIQYHMQLLDEVVGVSSLDRGVAANPRKSATEAGAIVQANNRRTRSRLTIIADAFSALGGILYQFLPDAFPSGEIVIPLANNLNRRIALPDPAIARMSFRVEAVELGNLSKQGQVETHAASISLLSNIRQQAPDLVPPGLLISETQKYLRALGNNAAADMLKTPLHMEGPQQRILNYVYGRTNEIPVYPQDDHEQFMAAYQQEILNAATQPGSAIPIGEIQSALMQHQGLISQRPRPAEPQSPVPGFNAQGQLGAGAMGPDGIPVDQIQELSLNSLRA
jgi:hypothetical protein